MRKHITPFLLIAGVSMLSLIVCCGFVLIVGYFEDQKPIRALPVLSEATMPDGTILALNAVTIGTNHDVEVLVLRHHFDPFQSPWRRQNVNRSTYPEQVVTWLSRRDPKSGRYLDFEWWSHSEVTNSAGHAIRDSSATRHVVSRNGHSSRGGDRPFATDTSSISLKHGVRVVSGAFRKFRSSPMTTLNVFNTAGDKVASLAMPNPTPQPAIEWEPETLPVSKTDGDLEVVLKSVRNVRQKYQNNGKEKERVQFEIDLETRLNGSPTRDWYAHMRSHEDIFGNDGNSYRSNLSIAEPAWHVEVSAYRHDNFEFEPSEILSLEPRELQQSDKFDLTVTEARNADSTTQIVAVAGPGKTAYLLPTTMTHNSTSRRNGSLRIGPKNRKRIECSTTFEQRDGQCTSTVECELPHIVIKLDTTLSSYKTTLRVTDDQGRMVRTHARSAVNHYNYYFLEIEPDARTVQFDVIVHEPKLFEFYVKPPIPEWPKK